MGLERGSGVGVAAPLLKASSKLALNPLSSPSRLGVVCAWSGLGVGVRGRG